MLYSDVGDGVREGVGVFDGVAVLEGVWVDVALLLGVPDGVGENDGVVQTGAYRYVLFGRTAMLDVGPTSA